MEAVWYALVPPAPFATIFAPTQYDASLEDVYVVVAVPIPSPATPVSTTCANLTATGAPPHVVPLKTSNSIQIFVMSPMVLSPPPPGKPLAALSQTVDWSVRLAPV